MSNRASIARASRVVPCIAAGILLTVAALSPGCKGVEVQTLQPIVEPSAGNIGDPCLAGDEANPAFTGYKVAEENIASPFAACSSGICLVNHVQGRPGCPLGQAAPTPCAGPSDTSCAGGSSCVLAGPTGPFCAHTSIDGGPPQPDGSSCASGVCNEQSNTCMCTSDAQCPSGAACDPVTKECSRYVCHAPGACQSAEATDTDNEGKSCCVPGTDVPVTGAVCGQCEKGSGRNAEEDIYCSCRCGYADGDTPDGSELCACPGGFECSQIRPNVGLGDHDLTGKYCIRTGTAYTDPGQCGSVSGNVASYCDGTAAN